MRIALAILLAIHGFIHLLGFLNAWRLAEIPQLTGATLFSLPGSLTRAIGLIWLGACLAFIGAASAELFRHGPLWWLLAGVGIIVSQLLVIYAWPDAKAGTIINIVLLIPVVFAWADADFQNETDNLVRAMFARATADESRLVTPESIDSLPSPVRQWLEKSGALGKRIPRTVRLKQRGQMRLSPDKNEMEATAQQYFRVFNPEFIWRVRVQMMHVLPVAGRDSYVDGRGRMLIKLGSLVPVVDAADEKIDQGALLRFLGELVWFPTAALSSYIHWEPMDATSAKATMTHGGISASAVFSFDDRGRFIGLTAKRYFGGGPDAKPERWEIEAKEWKVMDGCLVPIRGDVRWRLLEGDFTFYRWEVTELEYDPPSLFAGKKHEAMP